MRGNVNQAGWGLERLMAAKRCDLCVQPCQSAMPKAAWPIVICWLQNRAEWLAWIRQGLDKEMER